MLTYSFLKHSRKFIAILDHKSQRAALLNNQKILFQREDWFEEKEKEV
jgi:hypothetical protein